MWESLETNAVINVDVSTLTFVRIFFLFKFYWFRQFYGSCGRCFFDGIIHKLLCLESTFKNSISVVWKFRSLLTNSSISACVFKGTVYESGTEWDGGSDDPCTIYKCVAGVVTESQLQCYTPCSNTFPPRPGQCCETCLGKFWLFHFIFLARTQE